MRLIQAEINGLRNLKSVNLTASPGFNLITGVNGAGKSSVLEALYLLSTGYSFRTRRISELIHDDLDELSVSARFTRGENSSVHQAGIAKSRDGNTRLRLDFQKLHSMSEMTLMMPVKSLYPESHQLIQQGPSERRRFLDWGLFHVEPGFHAVWKQYRRALDQRNQALRRGLPSAQITVWDDELVQNGKKLDQWRQSYISRLSDELNQLMPCFEFSQFVSLGYRQGWTSGLELSQVLENTLENCQKLRTTTVGPHRADMVIQVRPIGSRLISDQSQRATGANETDGTGHNGPLSLAKSYLSRGQQKLLVYALHFSQLALHRNLTRSTPVLLCDDISSELDRNHLQKVLALIDSLELQTFITSNHALSLPVDTGKSLFHVESGVLTQISE